MSTGTYADSFVPELVTDFARVMVGDEMVVWAATRPEPAVLDPVAVVMLAVVDGQATVAELVREVHEEVGVALDVANAQVTRAIGLFDHAGLLSTSEQLGSAADAIVHRPLHMHPMSYCSDKLSRERGMRSLNLRFGDRGVRVACDSRRGARLLRKTLGEHLVADEQPLGFMLQKPHGRTRVYRLLDRAGVELATSSALQPVLGSLAGHLSGFATPESDAAVRVRVAVLASTTGYVACMPPLLYVPTPDRAALGRQGLTTIDRFVLDIGADGTATVPSVPWQALRDVELPEGHAAAARPERLAGVAVASDHGSLSGAAAVADLARAALSGTPASVLETLHRAVQDAKLIQLPPFATDEWPSRLGVTP